MDTESSTDSAVAWPRLELPEAERIIRFRPAYHRCTDPKGDYGIGSVHMLWFLRQGEWAVDWDVFTGWELPDEAFALAAPACTHPMHQQGAPTHDVMGGGVGFHSPVPQFEDHPLSQERCPLTEAPCYLDAGYLLGTELLNLLRTEGDEAVWAKMYELLTDLRSTPKETE
jgi:hypothetical protein